MSAVTQMVLASIGAVAASSATVTQTDADSANMGDPTLELTLDIGADGDNDVLYFSVGVRSVNDANAFSGFTVDGEPANNIIGVSSSNGGGITSTVAIFAIERNELPDPSQTNVDIVATANQNCIRGACAASVSPDASATAFGTGSDADSTGGADTLDGSLNTSTGAIVLGVAYNGGANTLTWTTGLTQQSNFAPVGAANVFTTALASDVAAETPRTISLDAADTVQVALVTASFSPQ